MMNYRRAFIAVLFVCVALAAAVAALILERPSKISIHPSLEGAARAIDTAPGHDPLIPAPANSPPPLAPLELSPQRSQAIGIRTGVVQYESVENTILASGSVALDERLESSVALRFAGWIDKVYVNSTYQYVRTGEPLFTIYSPAIVSAERDYLLAERNAKRLESSAVPGVAAGAASLVAASTARLRQWGVPESEIDRLNRTGRVSREIAFDSTVSGYVTERNALPQMYAEPSTKLYAISGLSTVWVYAQIFQNEIGQVRPGDLATVTLDSYPGREYRGRVDFIWPEVDPVTRSVKVRLAFQNRGLKLMPGMYVNVSLKIPLGRHLVIPATGVLQSGVRQTAFVQLANGEIEPREIQLGARAGDEFIVLKGLKAGDRIITSANFLIDSESQLQAALGSFAPPPPGAGQAAAMNQPGSHVEFSTAPSPARRGSNSIEVTLTDDRGQPVSGAAVTVTFFLPAMPAMGMSAMRAETVCSDEGGGRYRGAVSLPSGGAWKVSVVARKGGQTIGAAQLTLDVGGGM